MTMLDDSLDLSTLPELAREVDAALKTNRPTLLRRGKRKVAMIVPLNVDEHAQITPAPYNPALEAVLAGLPEDDPIRRTAGALHTDQPFPGYHAEKEIAMALHAAGLVASWEEE